MRIHGSSLNNAALRIPRQNTERDNAARNESGKNLNTTQPSKPSDFSSQSPEQIELILNDTNSARSISQVNKQTIENLSIHSKNAINAYTHASLQPLTEDRSQLIGGIDLYV